MLWNEFHFESNIIPTNIECRGNATCRLRFELHCLFEDFEDKKVVLGVVTEPIIDFWKANVTEVVGVSS